MCGYFLSRTCASGIDAIVSWAATKPIKDAAILNMAEIMALKTD